MLVGAVSRPSHTGCTCSVHRQSSIIMFLRIPLQSKSTEGKYNIPLSVDAADKRQYMYN